MIPCGQGFNEFVELALQHGFQLVEAQAQTVICHAILRKIVGSDLLASVSRSYLRASRSRYLIILFLLLHLQ